MQILRVKTDRVDVDFENGMRWGSNKVDLLTGPNGSGKTEVLTTLANYFGFGKKSSDSDVIRWRDTEAVIDANYPSSTPSDPVRVVAQTFSPFNRFQAPRDTDITLTDLYSEGWQSDADYVCVGLHRSSRVVGASVAKRTLEQALYRVSEARESAVAISQVLGSLNLQRRMALTYQVRPQLRELAASGEEGMANWISGSLQQSPPGTARSSLRRELLRSASDRVIELLSAAIGVIRHELDSGNRIVREFDFTESRSTLDFAVLQSLAVLRRFDLLTLKACELRSKTGPAFDVAAASSGQQQMLCSVIGIATATRPKSLVLIDEPELSLHPRWQMVFLDNLQAALAPLNDCHVVIATHSPLVVQRGSRRGAGIVRIGRDHHSTIAISPKSPQPVSVETTLIDVFETPVAGSVQLASELFAAVTQGESGKDEDREGALARLGQLRELYSDPDVGDLKALTFIEQAIKLIEATDSNA